MTAKFTIALAGNPNSGKTTVFNNLTGARQHVANYPGVTVERKEGAFTRLGTTLRVVDLPGTYSLTARSPEEVTARRFLLEDAPDVVVVVLDASNLERNLYLAVQIMEMGMPLVLALNMVDLAQGRGIEFDLERLSGLLGVPIVPMVATKNKGTEELKAVAVEVAEGARCAAPRPICYGNDLEGGLAAIESRLDGGGDLCARYGTRWVALKLLERDPDIMARAGDAALLEEVEAHAQRLTAIFGDPPELVIADRRYGFISGACQEAVRLTVAARHDMSDRIDAVVTNRFLGFPLFLGCMYVVFQVTFTLGEPPMSWIEAFFGWLGGAVGGWWAPGAGGALRSLLVDGIIEGVGGVLVFLPNLLLLFLAIAVLEDSGYMARAAFIMDPLMHRIGLHGKSFIPMVIGFGCSVPAIMATRTLEHRADRLTTMAVLPLMSCSARLPIYMLFVPAFFGPAWRAPIVWILYLIGIALAIAGAMLLRGTLFAGDSTPFVMELPPYRMPTARGLAIHVRQRGWLYIKKAGTIILAWSIVLWALSSYPRPPATDTEGLSAPQARQAALSHSLAGRIGRAMEPALRLMGFDWRVGTAILGAVAAKEVFVSQLRIVFAVGHDRHGGETEEERDTALLRLQERLRAEYPPLVAFCVMLFCLISTPCAATFAAMRKETGSWIWPLLQFLGLTALAFVVTVLVYQLGALLAIGVALGP